MCFHFFELKRVLVVLLLNTLISFSGEFFLDGLLESREILFLILHTSIEFSFQVVELSDFMRYPGLTFLLTCSLRYCQSTFVCLKGIDHIDLYQLFSFLDVDFHQLFAYQPDHLTPLLF